MNPSNNLILGGAIHLPTPDGADETIAEVNAIYAILYKECRSRIIQLLRQMPSLVEVAKTLQAGKAYRVVMPSGGGDLGQSRFPGLYTTNLHGIDGRFIGQAQLERITPDFVSSVNQLVNQQAFAEILQRLEAIDQRISEVLIGIHLDRIARVNAGIHLYYQAIVAKGENRSLLLTSAITELQKGLDFLVSELRNDISTIDSMPRSFFGMLRSFPSPHERVDKKLKPMQETYRAILRSAYFLPIAHESMGNPKSQEVCLQQLQNLTGEFRGKVGIITRWLTPGDANNLAETWESGSQIASAIIAPSRQLGSGVPNEIELQFTPTEITGEGQDERT